MSGTDLAIWAVAIVFAVSAILLFAVIGLKWAHRRRIESHANRRVSYLVLLSQHLAAPGTVSELSLQEAEDDAFIDAVIDVRTTLSGPSVDALSGIVDKTGLISLQGARLRSRFPLGRRLRAVVSLAEMGDARAARLMMHHLSDREPEIRVQCARGLARMRHTPAIDLILERLGSETPWVRTRFAESLALFGRDAAWPLTAFIRVNHKQLDHPGVVEAVHILERVGDNEVGPALTELLFTAEDPEVKLALIETLGSIGGPLALRPLRRMFLSSDWRIRAKTATAFGKIGDPSVNPILSTGLNDPSWWTRRNSAAALASLPQGFDVLYEALIANDEFARDSAGEALADCGELVAAKHRLEEGRPDPRDMRLIRHMDQPGMVLV